jgi:hypothetical protein
VSADQIVPSASTTSSPSTWSRILPWRSTCVPPALVETRPPTVADPLPPRVRESASPAPRRLHARSGGSRPRRR